MNEYRIASYVTDRGPRAGLIVNDQIHDLADLTGRPDCQSVLQIIEAWTVNEPLLQTLADSVSARSGLPIDRATLLAPILYPPAIYCAGANYADHIANMARRMGLPPGPDPRADGGRPFHFLKPSRSCVGQDVQVRAPSPQLDWEGELVAVIGVFARRISAEAALDHVAGYMVGNDLSARDIGFRPQVPRTSIFHHNFIEHKGFEHSAPVGPWIVPKAQVNNPMGLSIKTWVNDSLKQDGNTSLMIFSLQEQIAYLSSITPLYPGDIIMTGTPAGVGAESGEFLHAGDCVKVSIEQLGTLTTRIA